MSSKKWVWAVVVVVIILLALWYSGVFGSATPATQPAAVNSAVTSGTSGTAMAAQDTAIKGDVALLDAQIKAINTAVAVSGTPTKTQISDAAASFKAATTLFAKIAVELKARSVNAQTAGASVAGITSALSDLNAQVSNMSSQVSAASKNAMATSSTSATLTASYKQLVAAQGFAAAARTDIGAVMQTLGIK